MKISVGNYHYLFRLKHGKYQTSIWGVRSKNREGVETILELVSSKNVSLVRG